MTEVVASSVPVHVGNLKELGEEIRNSAQYYAKPRLIKNSSVKTYVMDPAGVSPGVTRIQIATYEPNRIRLAVYVQVAAVAIVTGKPVTSPDVAPPAGIPEGGYLIPSANPYEFFGPDEYWLNSIIAAAAAPVIVIKEYC
jgi:hypothetical protein